MHQQDRAEPFQNSAVCSMFWVKDLGGGSREGHGKLSKSLLFEQVIKITKIRSTDYFFIAFFSQTLLSIRKFVPSFEILDLCGIMKT